jgi:hypothetical protein
MHLMPGPAGAHELKIGTRIPVELKPGEMQYIDVGTNIWARITEVGDALQVDTRADLSSVADSSQQQRSSMPEVQQFQISGTTLATIGKPTILGSVDDSTAKRQFQLEVTIGRPH